MVRLKKIVRTLICDWSIPDEMTAVSEERCDSLHQDRNQLYQVFGHQVSSGHQTKLDVNHVAAGDVDEDGVGEEEHEVVGGGDHDVAGEVSHLPGQDSASPSQLDTVDE